jgi:K+-sensing histidine kinase KdpD
MMWLELASEITTGMMDFIMDMRYITATVSRVESEKIPLKLVDLLEDVSKRVSREYNLDSKRIVIELEDDVQILTCKIVKEMLWNIFDNAFKHGTDSLVVKSFKKTSTDIVVEIQDRSGGLPPEIQEFFRNSDALSSPSAPGVGLGIILIRGLSSLCNIPLDVQDVVENGEVVGSRFQLQFISMDSEPIAMFD